MNHVDMHLTGSRTEGWRWRLSVDGVDLEVTPPLATEDLVEGLYSIQRDSNRRTPAFDDISDRSLALLLAGFFAGDLYDVLRSVAEEQVWAKHFVSPRLPSDIPGHLLFLMEASDDQPDRLLAVAGDDVRGYRLPKGRFDTLLRDVRDRLDAAMVDQQGVVVRSQP